MSLILILASLIGCSSDDRVETFCDQRLYYVSSAVCSESEFDAAVQDEKGQVYIAQNIFNFLDRAEVTVDLPLVANYREIEPADNRGQCGPLIVAPMIQLFCLEVAD